MTGGDGSKNGFFPATQWSLVGRAGTPNAADALQALDDLLAVYRPALVSYLTGIMRLPLSRAEDLVQAFVAHRVLEANVLSRADAGRGKFRSFLLKVFQNYVISELRMRHAKRRGPTPSRLLSLEDVPEAMLSAPGEILAFDLAWAKRTLAEVVERMQLECRRKNRMDLWELFQCRILDPTLTGASVPPYEDLLATFGFRSPSQASNLLITARRMFQRILRDVVRDTVGDEADTDAEIRDLIEILSTQE